MNKEKLSQLKRKLQIKENRHMAALIRRVWLHPLREDDSLNSDVDDYFGEQERIAEEEARIEGDPDFFPSTRSPQTEYQDIARGK